MYDILQLNDLLVPELREIAEQLGLKSYKKLTRKELIYKILDEQALTIRKKNNRIMAKKTTGQKKMPRKPKKKSLLNPKRPNNVDPRLKRVNPLMRHQ